MTNKSETPVFRSTVTKNVNSMVGGRYSQETKQEVVERYLVLGDINAVSVLTGVEAATIKSWKKSEWWADMVASYRGDKALVLDANMARVVDKALSQIEDRLDNGELVLNNKTGELVRKPVAMKDASAVARDLMMRQQAIRKEEHETVQHRETTKEVLATLAKEFAKWAKKGPSTEGAEDIPFVEEVKD